MITDPKSGPRRLLVIGAHSADFVWRAGGAIAVTHRGRRHGRGGRAVLRRARRVRRAVEAGGPDDRATSSRSATARPSAPRRALGADFRRLDLGDYPLEIDGDGAAADRRRDPRVRARRGRSPTPTATRSTPTTRSPSSRSSGRGRWPPAPASAARSRRSGRRRCFLFEPHQPELCNFTPTTFVDITPVIDAKRAAMAEMKAQEYLQTYYAPARRASWQPRTPRQRQQGRSARPRRSSASSRRWWRAVTTTDTIAELARAGVGNRLRGGGRARLRRLATAPDRARLARVRARAYRRLRPGRQPDGPCGDGRRAARRGVVLTMPEPAAVALVGDLLATQAQVAGAAALLSTRGARRRGAARAGPADLGALGARAAAPRRTCSARSTCRSTVGGATIRPGDLVVLDADGAAVVEAERADEVLAGLAAAREGSASSATQLQARRAVLRARRPRGGKWTMRAICATSGPGSASRAADAEAGGEPAVLRRDARHGDRGAARGSRCTCAAGATTCAGA